MATLYFCVFDGASAMPTGDPLQEGTVSITASSAQSAVIHGTGRKRRTVRFYADADCFATWSEDPTALDDGTSGRPLGADNPEYFDVEAGHKIATIQRT